ncbi:EscV/YscV/HrcV family type III secretion system export apparatus protein [Pantoea sp. Al-1710]|uniref:EscV/YscV/HrcV family type III secretion system export apparatus protein n=1 Tax=Candidatus Pantoea communis TaxID=2608354 RepID=A0ABX0RJZ9_9GAMM|nr:MULTISPECIES: type III secretion system export apparatus subunit SctV [Pantoea]NIG12931.1 EscV/YscV/HrcV family type III secretion system export apparatus protein [Pantoea sp. Cy-640]NIG17368.1 EscV/YscV/HrcV family type III secretion system export apparatus protein [Pantoea communis]
MNQLFNLLNKIAYHAMERSEIVGGFIALAVVFMLIIPLPLPLIDVLIATNISMSCLLIMNAMFLPKPLAFSTFPSVLLLTTMFRLGLSISTTRQILLQQNAGHIVTAFGNFVVGGNLAVGLVVFLILTVVNFLVITKGSERVAEVAARFTLDAMPGKQMSIDSDLRAGLINVAQAKRRREDLTKESQLFGAMDGAMKFVKGDSMAGIVILSINLIGGFCIGILQLGMTAGDAMHTFSILTIGDGLIDQIPALLISLTSGMMITRVSANEESFDHNIGKEITQQLTQQPKAWIMAGVGMFAFSLLPGMPTIVFMILGTGAIGSGTFQLWRDRRQAATSTNENQIIPEENGENDLRTFNPARLFLLSFPAGRERDPHVIQIIEEIRRIRNRIVNQFGFTLPVFDIQFTTLQREDEFRFLVYEIPKVIATITQNKRAVERIGYTRQLEDKTHAEESDIAPEEDFIWLEEDDPYLTSGELSWSGNDLLLAKMEEALFQSAPRFIGMQETRAIVSWLQSDLPEVAQEFERVFPVARLSSVLQRLVAERISLRAIRTITESLLMHGSERDTGMLIDQVRIDIKEHLCYQHSTDGEGLLAWLLTPETEEILREALRHTNTDTFFTLDQERMKLFMDQIRSVFPPYRSINQGVMLVAQDLRSPLRTLIQNEFNHVAVLSFAELEFNLPVNVEGRIDINENLIEEHNPMVEEMEDV